MAQNSQIDNLLWGSPALPYDTLTRELDSKTPRIIAGSNMYATAGGKLIKRPGCTAIASSTLAKRVDRLWLYRTLENPAKVYILGSVYNAGVWEMYYFRADAGSPAWTSMGALRDLSSSTRPHEVVTSRGLAFIKGFPAAISSEKQGTVIFDGTTASTTFWGLRGPTTPAAISGVNTTLSGSLTASATSLTVASATGLPAAPFTISIGDEDIRVGAIAGTTLSSLTRGYNGTFASAHSNGAEVIYKNWADSSHTLTVDFGWRYVYGYETKTGHVTCRSPLESNPDKRPSDSGGFSTKKPVLQYTGQADTTNIPYIRFYRTSDGGGGFAFLERFANPGSGTQTYTDDSLAGLGGALDPLPDELLDANQIAPALDLNLPPPTVLSPKVQGTDTPEPSSPLEYFAGRIWVWIGNVLRFSGAEEILEGIPEEAWPANNFYRARSLGTNVLATKEALYAWTDTDLFWVRGNEKASFQFDLLAPGMGMPLEHPRARTKVGDTVVWMTQDYQIAMVQGNQEPAILSYPLGNALANLITSNSEVELSHFKKLDKDLILVNVIDKSTPANTRQLVLDLNRTKAAGQPFWNVPWTISASASVVGRYQETSGQTYLIFFLWNGTTGQLARWDETEATIQDAGTNYAHSVTFALVENPAGNHVNERSNPSLTSVLSFVQLERTKFTSDTDPTLVCFTDDLWTAPLTPEAAIDPPRRAASKGYDTKRYHLEQAAQRIAVKISKTALNERFELQTIDYAFLPGSGA